MKLEVVLGLEIHLHLKLLTKMFCSCDANIYGAKPNTHTCPVCLGLPGALPVANEKAIKYTQLLGLALNCRLNESSKFDRKNYFYPDLPKGYQISQYGEPLCESGHIEVNNKKINIRRVHIEEDTGKSFHDRENTLLDFNKSGMALIEVVTEPDFRSTKEASDFSKLIQKIVRYLEISDADMEKGQMRLEANISLRKQNEKKLPKYKVEIKNINSFKFLEKAVGFEIERQTKVMESGSEPTQENRGWDDVKGVTTSQREKEEAHDYRYFPEPDIPPMVFTKEALKNLESGLPELPQVKEKRLIKEFNLNKSVAEILSSDRKLSEKFEEAARKVDPNKLANLLVNKLEYRELSVGEIVKRIEDLKSEVDISSEELLTVVRKVLIDNKKAWEEYKKGKDQALMFLVGQVRRETHGKANAYAVKKIIEGMKDGTII